MIRDTLDRMTLGEWVVLAGVKVERVSLFGFKLWGTEVFSRGDAAALLIGADVERDDGRRGGRGAEAAREWELEVAGLIPAAQTEVLDDQRALKLGGVDLSNNARGGATDKTITPRSERLTGPKSGSSLAYQAQRRGLKRSAGSTGARSG